MIIKDPTTGQETEVFTAAETQQRIKDAEVAASTKAVEDYKTANPDKSQEVNKLQSDLEEANRKLKAAEDAGSDGDKSGQVERLRQERDDAQKKLNTEMTDLHNKINSLIGDTKKELLDGLSKGDVELRKKIEFEFDNYRPNANSKTEIKERMEKAYQLATGNKPTQSVMDNINSSGRGDNNAHDTNNNQQKEATPNAKAIGNVLGISDEDRKKYPPGSVPSGTAD